MFGVGVNNDNYLYACDVCNNNKNGTSICVINYNNNKRMYEHTIIPLCVFEIYTCICIYIYIYQIALCVFNQKHRCKLETQIRNTDEKHREYVGVGAVVCAKTRLAAVRHGLRGVRLRAPRRPHVHICTQYIKIVNFLTISQEINLARILTICQNFKSTI